MPEYVIIAKIDTAGVSAGRAKISQELSGIEADARRAGGAGAASLGGLASASARAGTAAEGLGVRTKAAATDATAMAAAAQASARASVTLAAGLDASTKSARLNSVAMRETLVVARELSRGNFTRLPGSLTLLGQGIGSQGGFSAYASALLNTFGILKKTQDAELALAAADAQTSAAAIRAATERTAANILTADTELALAEAQARVTAGTVAEDAAQAKLVTAHVAVAEAAEAAVIAENALAVAEERAAVAAVASAEATEVALAPVAIVLGLVAAAAAALYFIFRNSESDVQKATDKLVDNAKKADIDRQAHELFTHTLEGVTEALRKNQEAIDRANDSNKTQAELELQAAKIAELRLDRIYTETEANLKLARSRLAVNLADPNRGTNIGTPAQQQAEAAQAQVDALEADLAQTRAQRAAAQDQYTAALAQYAITAGQRDQADIIKRRYEGPGGLIDQASKAAQAAAAAAKAAGNESLAHKLVTTELEKQVRLLHNKEQAEVAAAQRAEADAKKLGQVLALPVSGGRITTRFGQIESGEGVGPHAHQGVDIATPVGTPVYARAGGTVDYARSERGYGNIIQINFGGGVSGRFAHLEKFNVKAGDVVDAGDIIGYSGGARGAAGAGDSTGPHLHYEERVGGHAVNPLTAKVQTDTLGAQQAGYKKAEEAAKAAAARAQSEKDFVERTIDAANETALPKIDALAAKIKKVMDDYRHQFHEAMNPTDAGNVIKALTDADAREVAQHFQKAYVDPLKPLQEGLGKTAVQQAILNAVQREETDRGGPLSEAQRKIIENYYQQEDVLKREDGLIRSIQQPLEDYRNKLLAINKALADGKINHVEYIAQIAEMNAPLRQFLDNAPPGSSQKGGFNVKDDTASLGDKASRNYQSLGDASKAMDENARYASELKEFNDFRKQHQDLDLNWNALEESLHQRHVDNLNQIDASRRDMQLSYGEQIADSVYQIAAGAFGKQSGLARAAFGVEKAFTIARASLAIYQDVAQAIKVGFPANIPLIAEAFAQGAIIVSAIRSITVPSSAGYMEGGYTGDTGRGTVAGHVHGQEFVVNADATSRNRALLEAINSGTVSARTRSISNDNAPGRPLNVQVHNYAGADIEVQPGPTLDDVVVIARKAVRDEAAKVVADDLTRANSKTSKALRHNFGVDRKRA